MTSDQDEGDWIEYSRLSGLENLFLEDSYVLDILEGNSEVKFSMEFVFTEAHPLYQAPNEGEQYCYHKGYLVFENVSHFNKFCRTPTEYTDANNEVDLGNIETFSSLGGRFVLSGDWGELDIQSESPKITYI